MAGCFGNSKEDKYKENLTLNEFEMENEQEEISCEWCNVKYVIEDSDSREPELYCSAACRSLHYDWSDEPAGQGKGAI